MKNLLPVVNPEIAFSVEHSLRNIDDKEYLKQNIRKLKKINPTIALWIKNFSKKTKDKKGAAFCGLIVYKLLESQSEANQMNNEII